MFEKTFAMMAALAIASSALASDEMLMPRPGFIGWGGRGATNYQNQVSVGHKLDLNTSTYTQAWVVVDDRVPHLVGRPYISQLRATIDDRTIECNFSAMDANGDSKVIADVTIPTIAAARKTVTLEFLRPSVIAPHYTMVVVPELTKTLSIGQILALRPMEPTDSSLLAHFHPLASETFMRIPVITLQADHEYTMAGNFSVTTHPLPCPGSGMHDFVSLVSIRGSFQRQIPPFSPPPGHPFDPAFEPVHQISLIGGAIDLAKLARLVGSDTLVQVKGKYVNLYTTAIPGVTGPSFALQVEAVFVRGQAVPVDLPLDIARLKALATQKVQEVLSREPVVGADMPYPQVGDVETTTQALQLEVHVDLISPWSRKPVGQQRLFLVDFLTDKVSEVSSENR